MQTDKFGNLEFFATCAKGLEGVLAQEVKQLGLHSVRPLASGVSFRASVEEACRALLWLRTASRLQLIVDRVPAENAEQLYQGCMQIDWQMHIAPSTTIAVYAKGENQQLRNSHFTALRVKDSICDQLREAAGWRPQIDSDNPDLSIRVNLHKQKATISIDFSGKPMHLRGYRQSRTQVEAPIKETLAAAILLSAGWNKMAAAHAAFADPFCGGGTLAIEAAMIAGDIAPGILRRRWGIQGWKQFKQSMLDKLVDEAHERAEKGMSAIPAIFASDIDRKALDAAADNARRAGLEKKITFINSDVANLYIEGLPQKGLLASNPPYGERLLSQSQLPSILIAMRQTLQSFGPEWSSALIVADPSVDSMVGNRPTNVIETCNGPIDVSIRVYDPLKVCAAADTSSDIQIPPRAQEFANRLAKMAKHRAKWARKNDVTCYRVYDADLPDYAVAIDLYQGAGKDSEHTWAHISEYAPPKTVDPAVALDRVNDAVAVVRKQFGLAPADVYLKRRVRSKGGSQYGVSVGESASASTGASKQDDDRVAKKYLICEGGHLFYVNFDSHLDTGIFLDTRNIRALIERNSRGKSFLNLFAYTGSATVYAAAGGAKSTHTVDMSQTYLDWAQSNMELNSFVGKQHTYERADVIDWVSQVRHSSQRYDLVYVDPPTFSNSKKMRSKSWDVQRDHAELLIAVSRILTPGGFAIFCCNLRNFKPDTQMLTKAGVAMVDISEKTVPQDFERNAKIHHCFVLKRSK